MVKIPQKIEVNNLNNIQRYLETEITLSDIERSSSRDQKNSSQKMDNSSNLVDLGTPTIDNYFSNISQVPSGRKIGKSKEKDTKLSKWTIEH